MRHLFFLLAVFGLAGCYAYAPVDGAAPRPGADLRAHLSTDGARRVARTTGRPASAVDGELVRATADALTLVVWRSDRRGGVAFEPVQDTLVVPRASIERLEVRRLSYLKTGLLMGGIGVGMYMLVESVGGGDVKGTPPSGGSGWPNLIQIPLEITVPR